MLWIELPTVHESLEEFETAVRVYYFIFGKYLIATDAPDITRRYYHYLTPDTEVNAQFLPEASPFSDLAFLPAGSSDSAALRLLRLYAAGGFFLVKIP